MDSVVGKVITLEKKRVRTNTFRNGEKDLSMNVRNKDRKSAING